MLKASVGPHRRHRRNPLVCVMKIARGTLLTYRAIQTWHSDTKPDAGRVFVRCNLSATSVNVTSWIEIALTWITMIESRVRQFNGGSADVVLRYSGGVLTPLLARRGLPSRAEKNKSAELRRTGRACDNTCIEPKHSRLGCNFDECMVQMKRKRCVVCHTEQN
jgi:hypothetical protein